MTQEVGKQCWWFLAVGEHDCAHTHTHTMFNKYNKEKVLALEYRKDYIISAKIERNMKLCQIWRWTRTDFNIYISVYEATPQISSFRVDLELKILKLDNKKTQLMCFWSVPHAVANSPSSIYPTQNKPCQNKT